jgi:hypothetical protein
MRVTQKGPAAKRFIENAARQALIYFLIYLLYFFQLTKAYLLLDIPHLATVSSRK